jgi:hypothetical protein
MHPQDLHALLLQQLQGVAELSCLSPEELLVELHALQLEAMYNGGKDQGDSSSSSRTGKKPLGDKTEEFLCHAVGVHDQVKVA